MPFDDSGGQKMPFLGQKWSFSLKYGGELMKITFPTFFSSELILRLQKSKTGRELKIRDMFFLGYPNLHQSNWVFFEFWIFRISDTVHVAETWQLPRTLKYSTNIQSKFP